jgi:hypothetical protein
MVRRFRGGDPVLQRISRPWPSFPTPFLAPTLLPPMNPQRLGPSFAEGRGRCLPKGPHTSKQPPEEAASIAYWPIET